MCKATYLDRNRSILSLNQRQGKLNPLSSFVPIGDTDWRSDSVITSFLEAIEIATKISGIVSIQVTIMVDCVKNRNCTPVSPDCKHRLSCSVRTDLGRIQSELNWSFEFETVETPDTERCTGTSDWNHWLQDSLNTPVYLRSQQTTNKTTFCWAVQAGVGWV